MQIPELGISEHCLEFMTKNGPGSTHLKILQSNIRQHNEYEHKRTHDDKKVNPHLKKITSSLEKIQKDYEKAATNYPVDDDVIHHNIAGILSMVTYIRTYAEINQS